MVTNNVTGTWQLEIVRSLFHLSIIQDGNMISGTIARMNGIVFDDNEPVDTVLG